MILLIALGLIAVGVAVLLWHARPPRPDDDHVSTRWIQERIREER